MGRRLGFLSYVCRTCATKQMASRQPFAIDRSVPSRSAVELRGPGTICPDILSGCAGVTAGCDDRVTTLDECVYPGADTSGNGAEHGFDALQFCLFLKSCHDHR